MASFEKGFSDIGKKFTAISYSFYFQVHTYVTLSQESDDLDDSSINSSTLSSPVHSAKSEETVVYLSSEFSSASSDKNLRHFVGSGNGSAGGSSISTTSMAPLFTNQMQQLFGGLGQGIFDFGTILFFSDPVSILH